MTLTIRHKNNRAWVEYKLAAAGWYLDALSDLEARTGELSRLVGEEMALDGALVGIASAFDAAVAGLIGAIEVSRGATNLIPVHQYSWQAAKGLARQAPAVTLACATAVDAALLGANTAAPSGWLAQVRQLRNRVAHENTLIRHFFRTLGGQVLRSSRARSMCPVVERRIPSLISKHSWWHLDRYAQTFSKTATSSIRERGSSRPRQGGRTRPPGSRRDARARPLDARARAHQTADEARAA